MRTLHFVPLLAVAALSGACFAAQSPGSSDGGASETDGSDGSGSDGAGSDGSDESGEDGIGEESGTETGSDGGEALCGDAVVEGGEECDDGNDANDDACPNDCTIAACGDGETEGAEQCDDANVDEADGCLSSCIAAAGPILRYSFDNTYENSGSLAGFAGEASGDAEFVASQDGQAVRFTADPDTYVEVPNARTPLSAHDGYTLSVWVYEDPIVIGTPFRYLFDFRGQNGGLGMYHGVSEDFILCAVGVEGFIACEPVLNPGAKAWHHLVLRYAGTGTLPGDGANVEVFVDGSLAAELENPEGDPIFVEGMAPDLQVGRDSAMTVDELRVYPEALTDKQLCLELFAGHWDDEACS